MLAEEPTYRPVLGFIGLGAMGAPMVRNLLAAKFRVVVFDLVPDRVQACVGAGAEATESGAEVVRKSDFILVSMPSSDAFVRLAEEVLLEELRPEQIVIDTGTTTPPETRRLGLLMDERRAALVEAPLSGGPAGADRADMLMFVGGHREAVERCRPVLEALTQPNRITYCGGQGTGQIVKGVNQLAMGLAAAAHLEAIAFGVRAGVDAATIRQAVSPPEGFPGLWRPQFAQIADQVAGGCGEQVGVKFRELPYFLREAEERAFELPLTEVLYRFCDAGERVVIDDNRQAPSFWRQLLGAGVPEWIEEER